MTNILCGDLSVRADECEIQHDMKRKLLYVPPDEKPRPFEYEMYQ